MLQSLHYFDKGRSQLDRLFITRRHCVTLSIHHTFDHLQQGVLNPGERLDLFFGLGSWGLNLVKAKLGVHLL
jgi:hypothetical protein